MGGIEDGRKPRSLEAHGEANRSRHAAVWKVQLGTLAKRRWTCFYWRGLREAKRWEVHMSDHISTVPFEERSFGVKAACEILSISESFYFELIAAKVIETYKEGRSRKITGRAINLYRTKLKAATEQGT
jgi:hypothetical protein